MFAAGDRHDPHFLQLNVAFDVIGDHRFFEPARLELGQFRQHATRIFQGPAHVAFEHDVDVRTGQFT
ncbi:hypothetical protein D3C71_1790740 [compost metagenome]